MRYIFLNEHSCGGLARSKWDKIHSQLPFQNDFSLISDFYGFDWQNSTFNKGDIFISAGGDGTLHSMVNAVIKHKGLDQVASFSFGHIGLGSNNSFLRPYEQVINIQNIPMSVSDLSYEQDLIKIKIDDTQEVFCLSNSSIGFLAKANVLFNQSKDIAVIKRWNSDLADVYTFFKTLLAWESLEVEYKYEQKTSKRPITNMHFMKKPFYATDLGFPEQIDPANGMFRFNVLWAYGRTVILKKFLSMMITKKFEQGRNETVEINSVVVHSKKSTVIEVDGEIYTGKKFEIQCLHKGIRLCK